MAEGRVERRLAAILAADVAGYSRLMGTGEEATLAALKACRRELVDPKIADYRGRIVKTTGDGALVEFPSAVDAVRCAIEIQRAMAARNTAIPEDRRIEFRIGINVGDIIIDDGDIYGDGVNIAARVESLASPGEICLADNAYQQIKGKLDSALLVIELTAMVAQHGWVANLGRMCPAMRIGAEADCRFKQISVSASPPGTIDNHGFNVQLHSPDRESAIIIFHLGALVGNFFILSRAGELKSAFYRARGLDYMENSVEEARPAFEASLTFWRENLPKLKELIAAGNLPRR
jgi:class 3 adenylate cyclase